MVFLEGPPIADFMTFPSKQGFFFPNQESPTSMMSLSFGLFPPCSPGERCQYRRERGFEHQERRSTVSSWGLTIPSIFLWG